MVYYYTTFVWNIPMHTILLILQIYFDSAIEIERFDFIGYLERQHIVHPTSAFSGPTKEANVAYFAARWWLGRVTHICVSELTIIGPDNGLSPGRRQAIILNNAGILLIGSLGANLSEISIEIHIFSFKKRHLKMSSGNWQPSCFILNELRGDSQDIHCWYLPLPSYWEE